MAIASIYKTAVAVVLTCTLFRLLASQVRLQGRQFFDDLAACMEGAPDDHGPATKLPCSKVEPEQALPAWHKASWVNPIRLLLADSEGAPGKRDHAPTYRESGFSFPGGYFAGSARQWGRPGNLKLPSDAAFVLAGPICLRGPDTAGDDAAQA